MSIYTSPEPRTIAAGKKLNLPRTDWLSSERTLVIALKPGCPFCADSAPLYRTLSRVYGESKALHLTAILPQDAAHAREYLNGIGVAISDVKEGYLASEGVPYTPTLLLVDRGGVIVKTWVGKLSDAEQSDLLKTLAGVTLKPRP